MKKIKAIWENGTEKEQEYNLESEKIIFIAEIKEWCRENNFKIPKFVEEDKPEEVEEWKKQKRTIELTNDEITDLEIFLHMTTNYREGERRTWEEIAREKDENGEPKYKNAESNKIFWEQQITTIEAILKKLQV